MPNHKLTLVGHPARKTIQRFLQEADLHGTERRLACADGVVAISGPVGVGLARELYDLDLGSDDLLGRFRTMTLGYGVRPAERYPIDNCAEAHLWMVLVGLHFFRERSSRRRHPHPRHAHIWVYEIDRKNRPKEDSPCGNCRQWVRREFRTVNGTA